MMKTIYPFLLITLLLLAFKGHSQTAAEYFNNGNTKINISTEIGNVSLPSNMFNNINSYSTISHLSHNSTIYLAEFGSLILPVGCCHEAHAVRLPIINRYIIAVSINVLTAVISLSMSLFILIPIL